MVFQIKECLMSKLEMAEARVAEAQKALANAKGENTEAWTACMNEVPSPRVQRLYREAVEVAQGELRAAEEALAALLKAR